MSSLRDFTYTFSAVRGLQGKQTFYQACVPFRVLASMLKLDDDADVTKRSQRIIEKPRAKKVSKYLENNADSFYVLPPLIGFIDGKFEFEEVQLDGFANNGRMHVDLDSKIVLFDGQHRAWGIREAMQLKPELGQETISIMFFSAMTLSERQQAFHDINFTQKTPAASICIAYNGRSDIDKRVIDTFSQSNIRSLIDYEKNTVSGKSEYLYSLKSLKDLALQFFVGDKEFTNPDFEQFVQVFFDTVNIPAQLTRMEMDSRHLIKHGWTAPPAFKCHSILPHAVTAKAIGMLGKNIIEQRPEDWQEALEALAPLKTFSKADLEWENRCVKPDGKMISNMLAVRLTYYRLAKLCGLELSETQQREEAENVPNLTEKLGV